MEIIFHLAQIGNPSLSRVMPRDGGCLYMVISRSHPIMKLALS